jgi:signal transduction histidine kinase
MSHDRSERTSGSARSGDGDRSVSHWARGDREDPEGVVSFNVVVVPRLRLLGVNLLFFVAAIHNVLVFGELDLVVFLPGLVGAELYCLATWGALRAFYAQVPVAHLGRIFLVTDLVLFDVAIWVSGGHLSLLWPVFVLRTADQLWLHRGGANLVAVLGPVSYALLLAFQAIVEGQDLAWGAEVFKLAILMSMNLFLVLVEANPWRVRERNRQLEEARRQAADANQSKTEFLGRMSHELRTPLNSVLGFTNVLLKKKKLGAGAQDLELLQRIRHNGMRLLGLVNDLLDLDQIEEGEMVVKLSEVELLPLITNTVDHLENWGSKENVKTAIVAPTEFDPIRADPSRLGQVLENLIGNALKFTEEGSVTVRVESEGRVVRRIQVEDTGVGIPQGQIRTIFLAFEQADGAKTRAHEGSGLGLAISSALCELMGMHLSVESVLGKGSTFTITLTPR